jgi:hypothetical protein
MTRGAPCGAPMGAIEVWRSIACVTLDVDTHPGRARILPMSSAESDHP